MSVDKTEGELQFQFNNGQRKLKTYKWMPEVEVKALVFLCHGYGECLMPYYDEVAIKGAEQGILCFGHDHTGHGQSSGDRVQISHIDEYILPILEHCGKYKMEYPNLPLFILGQTYPIIEYLATKINCIGHSMGGLLTIISAMEDDKKAVPLVKGIALVGPLVEVDPSVASPFLKFLARLLCRIFPNLSLSGINKRFITSDKDWMKIIESDSNRWSGGLKAQHSVVLLNRLEQLATEFSDIKIPMFILHGEEDKICTPGGSQRLHDQAFSQDKTIKMYKDAMHNLLLEKESVRTTVMEEIWDWVIQRHIYYHSN